jgi:hypothetical protein
MLRLEDGVDDQVAQLHFDANIGVAIGLRGFGVRQVVWCMHFKVVVSEVGASGARSPQRMLLALQRSAVQNVGDE